MSVNLFYKDTKTKRQSMSKSKRYDEEIKQYPQVKLEDNSVLTAKQIQEIQKHNTQINGESLI